MRAMLAAAGVVLALAGPAAAVCRPQTSLARLENEIMCPVCVGETLAQSDSPAAAQLKRVIQRRVRACQSEGQIKRELVAEYGTRILAAPPRHGFDLLAWVLPLVGILAGASGLALLAWRWSRSREEPAALGPASMNGRPLDPELEKRLDEELARFDG
jgi:cytochrome c-type biogenesis protein CcmH